MAVKHVVVRTHSHTDKQQLWKVLSRPISTKEEADICKQHFEALEKLHKPRSKHKFFVVTLED